MAISFINGSQNNVAGGSTLTLNMPASIAQDDLIVVMCGRNLAGTITTSSSGWSTAIDQDSGGTGNLTVFYKKMGASPDANIVFDQTTGAKAAIALAWRGVDTTTAMDATATGTNNAGSTTPDSPSITTVTNGAQVISIASGLVNDATITSPSGYGNQFAEARTGVSVYSADVNKGTAGAEDPGQWSNMTSARWMAVTVALRPQAAGGGSTARSFGMVIG